MEKEMEKIILELKLGVEALKTLLIGRGQINPMEYEELRDNILKLYKENHSVLEGSKRQKT